MEIKHGTTRMVILIGAYAFKIPQLRSWQQFLIGLLSNMQEYSFSKLNDKRLCPVLFHIPGGFLITMPRCKPLSGPEADNFNYDSFVEEHDPEVYLDVVRYKYCQLPVENKVCSFGVYEGRIVAVDYGS